jgi:hypothetical protein
MELVRVRSAEAMKVMYTCFSLEHFFKGVGIILGDLRRCLRCLDWAVTRRSCLGSLSNRRNAFCRGNWEVHVGIGEKQEIIDNK